MPEPFGTINLDVRDSTAVSEESTPAFELTGGRIVKVVIDVGGDRFVHAERPVAAAMARD